MKQPAFPYYRVSTTRQRKSGLSLDAQKAAIKAFAKANGFYISGEFTEVESGNNNHRPILQQALDACAQADGTLLITNIDRLSRNMAFTSALMESKVRFKAIDNPDADEFTIHILAAVAQRELKRISERIKAALQEAKARGTQLGSYGRDVLSKTNHLQSLRFAKKMKPLIVALQGQGVKTVRALADTLNRLHVPTFRDNGNHWHPSTVHKIIRLINHQNQTPNQ